MEKRRFGQQHYAYALFGQQNAGKSRLGRLPEGILEARALQELRKKRGSGTMAISKPRPALAIAYNALMAIGCIDEFLHSPQWCIERAHEIANAAIKELNVDHTEAVAKAIGLRGRSR